MRTIVALSQAAQEGNAAYTAYSQGLHNDADDANSLSEEEADNEMDLSMATYASKSPERPLAHMQQSADSLPNSLSNVSAMTALKPKFESVCNVIGTDQELILEFQSMMGNMHSRAMAKRRSKDKTYGSNSGMQSLPAADNTRRSKRIESCPTGNSSLGTKRAARKPPPT